MEFEEFTEGEELTITDGLKVNWAALGGERHPCLHRRNEERQPLPAQVCRSAVDPIVQNDQFCPLADSKMSDSNMNDLQKPSSILRGPAFSNHDCSPVNRAKSVVNPSSLLDPPRGYAWVGMGKKRKVGEVGFRPIFAGHKMQKPLFSQGFHAY